MAPAPAPKPCRANLCTPAYMAHETSPEHPKMTQECQRSELVKSALRTNSSTPSCCWRAALSGIMATPLLLGYRPPCHPICESGIAIVRRRGGPHWGTPSRRLTGATLPMNSAAPLLLRHTPSSLPIREPVSAIVWVCRGWWRSWHRWHDWLDWWQRWRCCGCATTVVNSATPRLLVCCPSVLITHGAIEWVHRTRRHWTSRWQCVWWRGWRRGWWCGRWCGWRSWWHRNRWLWQSCSRSCCGASPAHGAATEILLRLGPCCFPHRESGITIVRECACGSRQQPTQKREQQQQAQQTATGDDAGEISFWSNCVEVTSTSNILVGGFLYVLSLTRSHV